MTRSTGDPRPRRWSGLALGAALLVGCSAAPTTTTGPERGGPDSTMAATEVDAPGPTDTTIGTAPASTDTSTPPDEPITYPTGIVPVEIEIPAIGVAASTLELDLSGAEPEVPTDFADTGWYRQTRQPGEIGPAVIAGHIDSVDGPAVFARLDELDAGDEIVVRDAAGEERRFVVQRSGRYPKTDLPDEVFGFDLAVPELRLITCGGSFDRSTGHYRDNQVVYAVAA